MQRISFLPLSDGFEDAPLPALPPEKHHFPALPRLSLADPAGAGARAPRFGPRARAYARPASAAAPPGAP